MKKTVLLDELKNATGNIPYGMTNDYMFRAVLQSNKIVLKGLICSLLHLSEDEVISVEITNPIMLGEAITNKEFRLDINVVLNNRSLINLEMQIANRLNWTDRSLNYLCRSYDKLQKGDDYSATRPVIHIGFLDYTLFEEHPEFYATYKFMNIRNHHVYSDKLVLGVVELNHTELATEEDKQYGIDYWAKLFKAKTWEEIKMLAENNTYITEATNTIFRLSAEELIQKRCRDREEYYQDLQNYERTIAQKNQLLMEQENQLTEQRNQLTEQRNQLTEKDNLLTEKDLEIEQLKAQIEKMRNNI